MEKMTAIYLAVNIILLVAGQCVWKVGMQQITSFSIGNLVTSPYVWLGIIFYGVATVLWLKILSLAPMSLVYPLQSLAYVLGIVAAMIFFHETVPLTRIFGAGLILLGVYFISY